jgi:hypothetical protein
VVVAKVVAIRSASEAASSAALWRTIESALRQANAMAIRATTSIGTPTASAVLRPIEVIGGFADMRLLPEAGASTRLGG